MIFVEATVEATVEASIKNASFSSKILLYLKVFSFPSTLIIPIRTDIKIAPFQEPFPDRPIICHSSVKSSLKPLVSPFSPHNHNLYL